MAQDLAASGAELPAMMEAGRWKSPAPRRPATPRNRRRGAVARDNQDRGRKMVDPWVSTTPHMQGLALLSTSTL